MAMGKCFDSQSFIFTSPRGPLHVPADIDLVSFLLLNTSPRRYHQRLAIVDALSSQSFTYLEFHHHVRSVARAISSLGIRQHEVVLILSPNSIFFPVLFLAVTSLGAVVTTANPLSTRAEIGKQAKDCKTKLILTAPELSEKVMNLGLPVILIDGVKSVANPDANGRNSTRMLSDVIKEGSEHRMPSIKINQTDTAALLYSSGTTGVSKGVVLTHMNFIASCLQLNYDRDLHQENDLTFLCILPMFHAFGLIIIIYAQMQCGNTIVTMPQFDFVLMLQAIEKYRITTLFLVPPIILGLAKQEIVKKYDLSSVTEISSGAAPIGKETFVQIHQRLKIPDLRQGYGMTETAGIISAGLLKEEKKNYATVGPLVSGMEAVIVDPNSGRRQPPNKQGEIWLRGPNVMKGYLNNPEATASTLDGDGWLHTGDVGYIDDEANVYIVDRLKELIKFKGLQVAPAELEALLVTHSEIVDAAVVPLPDEVAGEVPLAYVVRARGSSLNEQSIIRFVAAQVAPYKKVRAVKFIDAIPKSSSGKILRRELIQSLVSKL
ncbi:hypothetical protein KP509_11G077700 [Ceratopteris richardii]|uniref:4-coumarate--CoA ligase n=1 Tax=Ceratopteris richardii TaxID=49495 RepID=A0A8T2TWX3_CERRI|nr:hypothetical protein KP509_11G077700 [Ceratopteris richardii]